VRIGSAEDSKREGELDEASSCDETGAAQEKDLDELLRGEAEGEEVHVVPVLKLRDGHDALRVRFASLEIGSHAHSSAHSPLIHPRYTPIPGSAFHLTHSQ
jgi:hypothetical protein